MKMKRPVFSALRFSSLNYSLRLMRYRYSSWPMLQQYSSTLTFSNLYASKRLYCSTTSSGDKSVDIYNSLPEKANQKISLEDIQKDQNTATDFNISSLKKTQLFVKQTVADESKKLGENIKDEIEGLQEKVEQDFKELGEKSKKELQEESQIVKEEIEDVKIKIETASQEIKQDVFELQTVFKKDFSLIEKELDVTKSEIFNIIKKVESKANQTGDEIHKAFSVMRWTLTFGAALLFVTEIFYYLKNKRSFFISGILGFIQDGDKVNNETLEKILDKLVLLEQHSPVSQKKNGEEKVDRKTLPIENEKLNAIQKCNEKIEELYRKIDNTLPRPWPSYRSQYREQINQLIIERNKIFGCLGQKNTRLKDCLLDNSNQKESGMLLVRP